MLRRLFLVILCAGSLCLSAQDSSAAGHHWKWGNDSTKLSFPHSVYLEGFGSGALGSLNYEHRMVSIATWAETRIRTGIGYYRSPGLLLMPVLTLGAGTVRGELSGGLLIQFAEIAFPMTIGLRYESADGIIARLDYTPIFERDPEFNRNYPFPIWFGVSVGFQLNNKNTQNKN